MSDQGVYVYVFASEGQRSPIKVGISKNVASRLRGMRTGCPFPLALTYAFNASDLRAAREIEECRAVIDAARGVTQ